jgi:hypothetical protein
MNDAETVGKAPEMCAQRYRRIAAEYLLEVTFWLGATVCDRGALRSVDQSGRELFLDIDGSGAGPGSVAGELPRNGVGVQRRT